MVRSDINHRVLGRAWRTSLGRPGIGERRRAVRGGRVRMRRVAVDAGGAQVSLCQPPSAFPIAGVIIALEAFHTAAQKTRLQPVPLKG